MTLNLRQQLYFESQVQTEDSRLSILALECYATPSQDRTAQPRYNLIENGLEFNFFQICEQFLLKKRWTYQYWSLFIFDLMTGDHVLFWCIDLREFVDRCSVDETLSFHPRPDPQSERWSIEAFQYVNRNNPFVFIHCKIKVCNATDPNSRCAQGCQPSRKRRDAETFPETPDDVYILWPKAHSHWAQRREILFLLIRTIACTWKIKVSTLRNISYFKSLPAETLFQKRRIVPKRKYCRNTWLPNASCYST